MPNHCSIFFCGVAIIYIDICISTHIIYVYIYDRSCHHFAISHTLVGIDDFQYITVQKRCRVLCVQDVFNR